MHSTIRILAGILAIIIIAVATPAAALDRGEVRLKGQAPYTDVPDEFVRWHRGPSRHSAAKAAALAAAPTAPPQVNPKLAMAIAKIHEMAKTRPERLKAAIAKRNATPHRAAPAAKPPAPAACQRSLCEFTNDPRFARN